MWHGIPLKDVRIAMENYDYFPKYNDYFVSTSDYMKKIFSKIFLANNFLITGYPRNDIFFRQEDHLDFINVNLDLYNEILKRKENQKIVLITPSLSLGYTGTDMVLSFLDLDKINKFGKKYDIHFILKLHPSMDNFSNLLDGYYENITIYPPKFDLYPLLKHVDCLITDYSSIFFDFLLLDKPIIFYVPNYKDVKSSCILDYDTFTPGEKAYSMGHLIKSLKDFVKGIDKYKKQREEIKRYSFDFLDGNASKRIADSILQISEKF